MPLTEFQRAIFHHHLHNQGQIVDDNGVPIVTGGGVTLPIAESDVTGLVTDLAAVASAKPTTYIQGGTISGNAASVAAATALNAAISGASVVGLHIVVSGYVTYTALPGPSFSGHTGITIDGVGSVTAGADSATQIEYTGSGSGSFITSALSTGCSISHMKLHYTNTAFTGELIDLSNGTAADTTFFLLDDVILRGPHGSAQTSTLLDLTQTVGVQCRRVEFNGGGIGVKGGRSVAVTAISVANPSVITAPAHGYANGDSVRFGGVTTTPSLGSGPTGTYVITVINANSFSIPVNVTNVADGVGFCNNTVLDAENSNPVLFEDCWFGNQDISPMMDAGQAWNLITCFYAPKSNGDGMVYSHTPGFWGTAVTLQSCWAGDITTTNAGAYITWAGTGLVVLGCRMSGRQVSQIAAISFDENGCDGYVVIGNVWGNMYSGIDFGSTTGHLHGQWAGNAFPNPHGSLVRLRGTIPRGLGVYDGQSGTVPDSYDLTGGSTATVLRFDGDTLAQIYRTGAGILRMDGQFYFADDIYVGQNGTSGTRVYGVTSTLAGIAALASGSNKNLNLESKGTGAVVLDGFIGTGGTQITKALHLPGTISPTQLVANTDNWAPTNQTTAYLIRINVDAARSIFGLVAEAAGTVHRLYNTTAFSVTLGHQAGTSTAANRFICPNAVDFVIRQFGSVDITYSTSDSRWLVLGA